DFWSAKGRIRGGEPLTPTDNQSRITGSSPLQRITSTAAPSNVTTLPSLRCLTCEPSANPMNTKSFLVCFIVVMLATSMATAGTHHGHFTSAQGGFVRNGTGSFHGGNWNGHWNGGNWHHHHHDGNFNDFVFIGSFGFPFLGYPYGYGSYPYSYGYSYYCYGYCSGYMGYGSGYY